MIATLTQDWRANRGAPKSQIILVLFRLCQVCSGNDGGMRLASVPARVLYRIIAEWLFGVDLPAGTVVGPRLSIHHGVGLVVHQGTVIGSDCTLRHCTTIGARRRGETDCPRIGNGVNVGANSVVLGPIAIGDNAKIGAGAVVLYDVPANGRAVGPRATISGAILEEAQ